MLICTHYLLATAADEALETQSARTIRMFYLLHRYNERMDYRYLEGLLRSVASQSPYTPACAMVRVVTFVCWVLAVCVSSKDGMTEAASMDKFYSEFFTNVRTWVRSLPHDAPAAVPDLNLRPRACVPNDPCVYSCVPSPTRRRSTGETRSMR